MYKIGRNEPCPCGSGRKYKSCCLLEPEKNEALLRAATQVTTREELLEVLEERARPPRILRLSVKLLSKRGWMPEATVSRTLEIEDTETLHDLHLAIQDAFGWDNDHVYCFFMSNRLWDSGSEYSGDPVGGKLGDTWRDPSEDAAETELRSLGLERGRGFKYVFDMGDDLVHAVRVLQVDVPRVPGASYPRVVKTVGEAPPQYDHGEE